MKPYFSKLAGAVLALGLLSAPVGRAGGSIDLADLQPLLDQQPVLWKFYTDRLDISPHGWGLRLGSPGIPLRGARVPPYEFPAHFKGEIGAAKYAVKINADVYFFDANGKPRNDEMKATSKKEVLVDVALEPIEPPALK